MGKSLSDNVNIKKLMALMIDSYILKTLDPAIFNKFKDYLLKILIGSLDEMNSDIANFKKEFKEMYSRL
jgi:hypothetical protein